MEQFLIAVSSHRFDLIVPLFNQGLLNPTEMLLWAIQKNNYDLMLFLIDHGADIHYEQDLPLGFAARSGNKKMVTYLVQHGAIVTSQENYALGQAVAKNHLDIVQYLVEQGADINDHNHYAIRTASINGFFDIVKFLMERGANFRSDDDKILKKIIADGQETIVLHYLLASIPERERHSLFEKIRIFIQEEEYDEEEERTRALLLVNKLQHNPNRPMRLVNNSGKRIKRSKKQGKKQRRKQYNKSKKQYKK